MDRDELSDLLSEQEFESIEEMQAATDTFVDVWRINVAITLKE